MGSKGSQTTVQNTQSNQTYTPAGLNYLTGALGAATNLAGKSVPTVPTAPVAGLTGQQEQAFGLAGNTGIQNPYLQQAQSDFSPQGAQQFFNPFAGAVTAQMQNIFGQQQQQNNANLVQSAGGVGADRIAVGQGNLANQQALAAGQTYANLYGQAAQQAQSAGYGTAGLGAQAQQANMQDIQTLLGAGGLQQQQQQAQLNAPYQQSLAQMALPYQLGQWYSGQVGALAPALGGTSVGSGSGTTTGQYNPSTFSQITGGLLGLGSIFGKGAGGNVPYARGGTVNPYAFDDGGGVHPVDVSAGIFAGPKLFRLPEQSPPPARTHVPNLNLTPAQIPNMPQQSQQDMMKGMQTLGKEIRGLTGPAWGGGSLFGGDAWGGNASNPLPGLGASDYGARGGVFARGGIPHFDDGGSSGDDSDSGGGFGAAADAAAAEAAATGMASGVTDDMSTTGFTPSEMTSNMTDPGSIGDNQGIAGFGPGSVGGPSGTDGFGFGFGVDGLGMNDMVGPPTIGTADTPNNIVADDFAALTAQPVGINQNVAPTLSPNQMVAQEFGQFGPQTPQAQQAQQALTPNQVVAQDFAQLASPQAAPTPPDQAVTHEAQASPFGFATPTGNTTGIGPSMSPFGPATGGGGAPLMQAMAKLMDAPYGYRRPQASGYPSIVPAQGYDGGGTVNPFRLRGYADGSDVDYAPDPLSYDDQAAQGPSIPAGDEGLGTVARAYQGLEKMGLPRGQMDMAAQKAGPVAAAAELQAADAASGRLPNAVALLESSGRGVNGPAGRFANQLYQQYPAFAQQYGAGADGVTNYAKQVLKAHPDATLGDFYGGYVTGTGNPAAARLQNLLTTTQPGARGAYANLMGKARRGEIPDPSTPLASLIGGDAQGTTAQALADEKSPQAVVNRIANGLPGAIASGAPAAGPGSPGAQQVSLAQPPGAAPPGGLPGPIQQPPPPQAQTAPPESGSGFGFPKLFNDQGGVFGSKGPVSGILDNPKRVALLMAAMGAWTPQGIAGGFQQGMQYLHGQQSIDQGAKRLEQEANFHQDAMERADRPYHELTEEQKIQAMTPREIGRDLYGRPVRGVLDLKTRKYVDPGSGQPIDMSKLGEMNDEQVEGNAQAIAHYQQPAIPAGKAMSPIGMQMMQRARQIAQDEGEPYNQQYYNEAQGTRNKFAYGTQGDAVRSYSTAYEHIEVARKLIDAMNTGDVRTVNRLKNWLQTELNLSSAPSNSAAANDLVADEITKAVIGAKGALGDREEAKAHIDAAKAKGQLFDLFDKTYKPLMMGQLHSYERQFVSGTHGGKAAEKEFAQKLSPSVHADLEKFKGAGEAAAAPATPPAPAFKAPANAVARTDAKGKTWYFDPDSRKPYPGQE